MPFTMPNHRAVTFHDRNRDREQRTVPSMNLYTHDPGAGKMYPEPDNLPQNVRDAIRLSDNERY